MYPRQRILRPRVPGADFRRGQAGGGAGDGVSVNFNWGAPVAATTIRISVFNTDLKLLFSGEGGMALNEAVDVRSGSGFVRRREILGNEDHIREGIALALHPLVPMANWPGNPD